MDHLSALSSVVGETVLRNLVAAFYRRVRVDPVLGPLYPPSDWEGAEKRLADFLVYRFGGDSPYLRERGHPRLRARHMPFRITSVERDRWLELMREAMSETAIPASPAALMEAFFGEVASAMRNQPD